MGRLKTVPIAAAALLAAAVMAGCSTGNGDSASAASRTGNGTTSAQRSAVDADAFPVTIKHHFGSTTITSEPARIATLGTNDPDNLLTLGVVPVGVTKVSWGGNARGSTPWFDTKLKALGATMPTQYDNTDSVPFTDIAALDPDLILATNSGITKAQYDKLSKIAPVVAYPDGPWTTTWQRSLLMDGRATGRVALAERIEKQTEHTLDSAKTRFPQIQGKTFIFASLSSADMSSISYYTPVDARTTFLTSIGMTSAPVIDKIAPKGAFYGQVSAERAAQLKSDVFITYAEKASDAATFTDNTLIGQVPAIKSGHLLAATDKTVALSATIPTPLSIPYALKHFVPLVAKAVTGEAVSAR